MVSSAVFEQERVMCLFALSAIMPAKQMIKNNNQSKRQRQPRRVRSHADERITGLTPAGVGIFPLQMTTYCTWSSSYQLNPAGSATDVKVIRLSPYDPDYAFGGTPAVGWTQASALYGAYRPISAQFQVDFTPVAGNARCFVVGSDQTTLGTNPDTISAQPYSWMKSVGAAGSPVVRHSFTVSNYKLLGIARERYMGEENFGAPMSSNGQVPYVHIGAYADGTTAGVITVSIRIVFKVQFYQPVART